MYAKTFRRLLLASSVLWASHAHAEAAAADARSLSEVVVTAHRPDTEAASGTKSATPLVETPQSVSVIDRADLDLRVVQNLNEAVHFIAGVGPDTRGNTGGRYDLQTLRGFTADQYLDGMRLVGSANGYALPQIDLGFLERVEVVKGPASVMYGSASPGGLVALSSKLPTADRFGQFTVSGGSFATVRGVLDVGGPLNDSGTLSYRLVTLADRSDTETRLTGAKRYGISPAITWRPDDKTSWTLLYNYQRDPKTGDYGAVPLEGSLLPNPNGRIARDFYVGEPGFERFDRTQNNFTSLFTRDLGGDWVFRQSTRFMRTKTKYRSAYLTSFDAALDDFRTLDRSVAVADETVDALTLDNQLSGVVKTGAVTHNVLVGLDYQNARQTEAAGFGGSVGPIDAFDPVYGASPIVLPDISFDISLRQQQTGLYAQDQMALGGFRLVLSGRNDWVKSNQTDRLFGGATSLDQHKFTGRAGLLYLFGNGVAPYVSYATSFQPQTATDRNGDILAPTVGKQVEAGVKYQPKAWNALLTAAIYDLRQTNVATQDPTAPIGVSVAAGEVRSRGIELEGSAQPIPALRLRASYTYLDNVTVKDNSGLVGARPYGVPQATANAYAIYTFQDGPLDGFGLGGAVRYLGRSYNGVVGVGEETIPAATLFDLLVSYDLGRLSPKAQGLTFNLDATNLFDKRYISSCYSTIWCWYGSGRNVQASLSYRW